LLLAQAQLKNGEWAAATATINRVRALGESGVPGQTTGLELIALLATVAGNPAEGPQVQLLDYVSRQAYPLRGYRMIIETLLQAQRLQVALEVAIRAERYYAGNASLMALKAEAQAALAEAATRAVKATVASAGEAPNSLLTETGFFNRVDEAISTGRWGEAQAAVRDVQLAKPGWLGKRQADLLIRQMRIARELRESLDMILAARLLQDGTLARAQLVVDFATELQAGGVTEDAVLLLREVLRKLPNHALARRLIETWQKKPEAPPTAGTAAVETGVDALALAGNFLGRLDAAITEGRWADAREILREAQRLKPVWLVGRQAELLVRHMRIAHETGDTLNLGLAASLLQDGSDGRAQLVVRYATELQAKGATAHATVLLTAVLRKQPEYAPARQLLEAWEKAAGRTPSADGEPASPSPPGEG
jgi:tetratricopeptide (TPR) repeat protein